MTLYIDSREPDHMQETVKAAADQRSVDTEVKELETGDFVVGNIAIERKEAGDLNSSITDQRIFEQTTRMAADFDKAYVIIEGDPYEESRGPTNSSIAATLASISHKKNVHVVYTPDHVQTAKVVSKLAEYVESNEEYRLEEEVLERTSVDTESLVVHTLCGIDGISPTKARVIREEVAESVSELLTADPEDLQEVDGVGPTLSQRIHDQLRYDQ